MDQDIIDECKARFKEGVVVKDFYGDFGTVPPVNQWKISEYTNSITFSNKADNFTIYLYAQSKEAFANIVEMPSKKFSVFF